MRKGPASEGFHGKPLLCWIAEVYKSFSNRFTGETKKVKFIPSLAPLTATYTLPFPLLFHLIPQFHAVLNFLSKIICRISFSLTSSSQGEYLKIDLLMMSKYIHKGCWAKKRGNISRGEAAAQTNMTFISTSLQEGKKSNSSFQTTKPLSEYCNKGRTFPWQESTIHES